MAKAWVIKPVAREGERDFEYARDLHDPFLLKDMDKAVARLWWAMSEGEKIMIFADYDADGVPGAAAFALFLRKLGFTNFVVYLPDRHLEDHGLSELAVRQAAMQGVRLIVTIDCGIASVAPVALAKELGLDVIITDHHLVGEELPPADAVVDPKRADCEYPYKMLCGAGVIFKVIQALIATAGEFLQVLGKNPQTMQKFSGTSLEKGASGTFSSDLGIVSEDPRKKLARPFPGGWEKTLLDLVAIATVSDMVPLAGENRALVHFGLRVLRRSPRPGLVHLCRELGLEQSELTEDDIGFSVGPRLNAASRMAHASEAFELLATADVARAGALARKLEANNRARKTEVERILSRFAAAEYQEPILVVGGDDWLPGVLGLAASRLVELSGRPVFTWGKNGHGLIKGSCRSDGTVNVVALMRAANADNFFENVGGHAQAGGFSLQAERLPELAPRLLAAFAAAEKAVIETELALERELELAAVTAAFHNQLQKLGPFGLENPKPVFWFRATRVARARRFGGERNHLELLLEREGSESLKAMSFFQTFPDLAITPGATLDLAATIEKSFFRGANELRLRIVDLRRAA